MNNTIMYVRPDGTLVGMYSGPNGDIPEATPSEADARPSTVEELIRLPDDAAIPINAWQIWNFPGWIAPPPDLAYLASAARAERDRLLRDVYDKGTQMVRRELETSPLDPVYESKLIAKRTELHDYARALQGVPDQSEFPLTIVWPAIPTEELS